MSERNPPNPLHRIATDFFESRADSALIERDETAARGFVLRSRGLRIEGGCRSTLCSFESPVLQIGLGKKRARIVPTMTRPPVTGAEYV